MRFTDLEKWLCDHGWRLDRIRGSHFHFKHTQSGQRVTIVAHGREIEPGAVRQIVRDLERTTDNGGKRA